MLADPAFEGCDSALPTCNLLTPYRGLRYYRRGPDRRPVRRPVVTTGATDVSERDTQEGSTQQIKRARRLAHRRRPSPQAGGGRIPAITVGQENNADVEIYYEDHGAGQPVVL